MLTKRLFDILLTLVAVPILLIVGLPIALWVKLDSTGAIFFKQVRVGRFGRPFQMLKFRSMVANAENAGPKITVRGDSRITRSGRILRATKLDELPQLINVLKGDMSLVGPRPEVPEYVEMWPQMDREKILSVRPGITDFATVEFVDEEAMLAQAPDPRRYYVDIITPQKLAFYRKYVEQRSLLVDIGLIARTLKKIILG